MPTNNARASNLSLPQYGYDLVVATTQDAINATTKQFLSAFKGKEFVACYKFVKGHAPELMDYNTVKQAIGGADPFTIPNGADESNSQVAKLGDLDFLFAFRAKMGLPPGLGPTEIPDVVVPRSGQRPRHLPVVLRGVRHRRARRALR